MQDFLYNNVMKLGTLRDKKLNFKDTFLYTGEILFLNFLNFFKLYFLWVLFSFFLVYTIGYLSDYFVGLFFILAYTVFYLFYLSVIAQSRAVIDETEMGVFSSLKRAFAGFINRKGVDLLELLPTVLVIFLLVFFPSSIVAVPLAFILILATIAFTIYTILTQPVVVIKKIGMLFAIRYGISLISGYFIFVASLLASLAIACSVLYIPLIFIKTNLLLHYFSIISLAGIEVFLFAIMLTVIYTNLEVAWSVGFRNYEEKQLWDATKSEDSHELTELFNTVPEVQIKEENKENK